MVNEKFVLPQAYLGTWTGRPNTSVVGPFLHYLFSISQSQNGDYLLDVNLVLDSHEVTGYQRFYIQGSGAQVGTMRYCGSISNFSSFTEETSHVLVAQSFPTKEDTIVTFCINNTEGSDGLDAFPTGCTACSCMNWTMAFNPTSQKLTFMNTVSDSTHLAVDLTRVGDPPAVLEYDLPDTCNFTEGGKDSGPVDRLWMQNIIVGLCPHMSLKAAVNKKNEYPMLRTAGSTTYDHCYKINDAVDYRLQWNLSSEANAISIEISAPASDEYTWVALGFRPMSRFSSTQLDEVGTGRHKNFGMQGADIVVGSATGGVRTMYAYEFIGEPHPDSSLTIRDVSATFSSGRIAVAFTRDISDGFLHDNYGVSASILSPIADVIWAVGNDNSTAASGCGYHAFTRGLRIIDWENPEMIFGDTMKC